MSKRQTTVLEHALLGLLYQKPSSGYDLRKIFASTSMGSFSDSPGAIYPALRRLEAIGMVRSRNEVGSARRRRVFSLTPKGTTELKEWLRRPVSRENVISGLGEFMLRFAFSEPVLGSAASIQLLQELQRELVPVVSGLREQRDQLKPGMPLSGTLALESGVRGHECLLDWCEHAIKVYEERSGD